MYITLDCEWTQKNEFIIGSIVRPTTNNEPKIITHTDPKELWNEILKLGEKQKNLGKNLYVYAHSIEDDLLRIMDLTDPQMEYINSKPFIASYIFKSYPKKYKHTKTKPCINFYDTTGLIRGNVAKIGRIINLNKLKWVFDEKNEEFEDFNFILKKIHKFTKKPEKYKEYTKVFEYFKRYNQIDALILYKFIQKLKKHLKNEDMQVKKLITHGQIAKSMFKKIIYRSEDKWKFYKDVIKQELNNPNKNILKLIRQSYRGPRDDTYQYGEYKNAGYFDINSSYGYALTQIEIPDFSSFEYKQSFENNEIDIEQFKNFEINKIGCTGIVLYKKEKSKIGYIPVRFERFAVFPNNENMIIIGTYTNLEIKDFIKKGFEIKHIFFTAIYQKNLKNNIFKKHIEQWYENRKISDFHNYFYKGLITNGIGKLAERKKPRKWVFDDVKTAQYYIDLGYKIKNKVGHNYMYELSRNEFMFPKFYMPIIPAYVTAYARQKLYNVLEKIEPKDRLATNTDSVLCYNPEKYKNIFEISDKLGDWKFEINKSKGIIYGKNTYNINDEIKVSGVTKKDKKEQLNEFNQGQMKYTRRISFFKDPNKAGIYEMKQRDLSETTKNQKELEDKIKKQHYFVDNEIITFEPFNQWEQKNIDWIKKFIKLEE